MFTQNEIVNGGNYAAAALAFFVWIAVIWLFYKGPWRQSKNPEILDNSEKFLKGVCLDQLGYWTHRVFWISYLSASTSNLEMALYGEWRWVTPMLVLTSAIGKTLMLYPVLKYFAGANWKYVGALTIVVFYSIGIKLT